MRMPPFEGEVVTESSHLYSSCRLSTLWNLLGLLFGIASLGLFFFCPTYCKPSIAASGAFSPWLARLQGKVKPKFPDIGGPAPINWSAPLTEVCCHAE